MTAEIQFQLKYLIEIFPKENIFILLFYGLFSFKSYLEAFYKFCKNHGDVTAEIMCPILEVRVL